jgi:hypothetical protein
MQFDVSFDIKAVERMLKDAERAAIPKATVRALNKTGTPVQKEALRILSKDIGIAQKDVRKNLKMMRARRNNLNVLIEASGRRIPLIAFDARQIGARRKGQRRRSRGRGGVTYKKQGGARGFIPGAFIATMRSGHVGVFKRTGKARLPIKEKFGPSIPHVFVKQGVNEAMLRVAKDRWPKNFEHEIQFELDKLK